MKPEGPVFFLNQVAREIAVGAGLGSSTQTIYAILKAGFDAHVHQKGGERIEFSRLTIRSQLQSAVVATGMGVALKMLADQGLITPVSSRGYTDGSGETRGAEYYLIGERLRQGVKEAIDRTEAAAKATAAKPVRNLFAAPSTVASFAL